MDKPEIISFVKMLFPLPSLTTAIVILDEQYSYKFLVNTISYEIKIVTSHDSPGRVNDVQNLSFDSRLLSESSSIIGRPTN